jgi:ribonuclease HII
MLGPVALYVVAIHAHPANAGIDSKKFSNKGRSMLYLIPIQRQGPQASELTEVESDNAGITVIKA